MWVDSFLDYLTYERNYSPRTIREYRDDLKAFESFYKELDPALSWETVDRDIVRNWMVSLIDNGLQATSVNRRLSALRTFYKYLLKRGWLGVDPTRGVRGPKKKKPLPVFLKENEINRLLDGDFFGNGFVGKRDRVILNMFYATGVRLSELVGLKEQNIDLGSGSLRVVGKRNKQRIIPFGEELKMLLTDYLAQKKELEPERGEDYLFITETGEHLAAPKVRKLVQYYLSQVTTLTKKSPHVLRHTFATSMLNHHANLESLKELLGHDSISTTEVYTHTTFEELKEMYNQAHPRA